MQTRQIASTDWLRTMDTLSRSYDGAIVSVEILGGEVGIGEEVHEQPLRGITSDPSGVSIRFEKEGGLHLNHRIPHPISVRILETDEGAVMAIEFRGDEGVDTLLRFRSPARPEIADPRVE